MTTDQTATGFGLPSEKRIGFDHPWAWLAAGARDMKKSPHVSLSYGALFAAMGCLLTYGLYELDAVYVALGGGGLISGIAGYLKSLDPDVEIVACSPAHSSVMADSVRAGRILDQESQPTLSDGTAGGVEAGAITFELCRTLVDRYLEVTEAEIEDAMRFIIGRHHTLIEGAAAVPVAALLNDTDRLAGRTVAVVLCGANIALETLREVL